MKNIISIFALALTITFTSCQRNQIATTDIQKSQLATDKCQGNPPEWCARARCSNEGKPVCGCNGVTYANECQAQCDGVTSYTFGTCDNGGGKLAAR